jgi:hypothetical protein
MVYQEMTPRDRIALTIAAGLVGWGLVALILVGWKGRALSEVGGQGLLAIGGGLVSALSAYFATRNGDHK